VLGELWTRGLVLGVISNSHRSLDAFREHFQLDTLLTAAVSSAKHGYMKPHPSIFEAAL
jgi:FMN phosphatase YigB (HAD superfamily)